MFGFESFFGGGSGAPEANTGPVDNKKLYQLLGLTPEASSSEIKKAYRQLALTKHPDKGGDVSEFQAIQRAYEVLSDPEKRSTYDKYGEEGLSGEGPGAGGMDDVMRALFRQGRREGGPPRGKPVGYRVSVSLEELYLGADKEVDWERKVVCLSCNGVGGPPESKQECATCGGQGVVIRMLRMGPMIQQQQMKCPACNGARYSIKPSLRCKSCSGEGIVEEHKKLKFTISPGMAKGDQIPLAEEGDKLTPDMIPGDVIMIIDPEPHPQFERKGDHLIYTQKITLLEALTGFFFPIVHLDGRTLRVLSEEGRVYKHGETMLISDEGMPTHRNPLLKGHLMVKFDVVFPDRLSVDSQVYESLAKVLPAGSYRNPKFAPEAKMDSVLASGTKKKKKKNKKLKDPVSNEDEEVAPEVIDVTLEEISEETLRKLRMESQEEQGHGQGDEEESGGTQCHVQ